MNAPEKKRFPASPEEWLVKNRAENPQRSSLCTTKDKRIMFDGEDARIES